MNTNSHSGVVVHVSVGALISVRPVSPAYSPDRCRSADMLLLEPIDSAKLRRGMLRAAGRTPFGAHQSGAPESPYLTLSSHLWASGTWAQSPLPSLIDHNAHCYVETFVPTRKG
jgi:hypothetical protein